VEDFGRGLKSAAQNVEKDPPKIGSAIGETFKTIPAKSSEKIYKATSQGRKIARRKISTKS
jgi:hypothetical protein